MPHADFDEWAKEYENDRRSKRLVRRQRRVYALLNIGAGDVMCDIGCGSGASVRVAADDGATGIGIDSSAGMVERARELAADRERVYFARGEAGSLPLRDGSCTAIMSTASLHHFSDPAGSLADMVRALSPGGRLVVADFNADSLRVRIGGTWAHRRQHGHIRFRTLADLRGYVTAAGLTDVRVVRLRGNSYVAVTGRKP